jgi:hypothetical protein
MTTKEKVEYALARVEAILEYDFITTPVREALTDVKTHLESVKASL